MAKSKSGSASRSSTPSAPTPRRRSQRRRTSTAWGASRKGSRWSTTTKSLAAPCILRKGNCTRSGYSARSPHDQRGVLDLPGRLDHEQHLVGRGLLQRIPHAILVQIAESPEAVPPRRQLELEPALGV